MTFLWIIYPVYPVLRIYYSHFWKEGSVVPGVWGTCMREHSSQAFDDRVPLPSLLPLPPGTPRFPSAQMHLLCTANYPYPWCLSISLSAHLPANILFWSSSQGQQHQLRHPRQGHHVTLDVTLASWTVCSDFQDPLSPLPTPTAACPVPLVLSWPGHTAEFCEGHWRYKNVPCGPQPPRLFLTPLPIAPLLLPPYQKNANRQIMVVTQEELAFPHLTTHTLPTLA